ncbi:MAG: hypothetical protein JNK05_02210 [Myxococcales bacterium]|nr:hypothetical protein [Myxococcales bacterium]
MTTTTPIESDWARGFEPFVLGIETLTMKERRQWIDALCSRTDDGTIAASNDIDAIVASPIVGDPQVRALTALLKGIDFVSQTVEQPITPKHLGVGEVLDELFDVFDDQREGFRAVVHSMSNAVARSGEDGWSQAQCECFIEVAKTLCVSFDLSFDESLALIDALEAAGFQVYSAELDEIADWGKADEQADH